MNPSRLKDEIFEPVKPAKAPNAMYAKNLPSEMYNTFKELFKMLRRSDNKKGIYIGEQVVRQVKPVAIPNPNP